METPMLVLDPDVRISFAPDYQNSFKKRSFDDCCKYDESPKKESRCLIRAFFGFNGSKNWVATTYIVQVPVYAKEEASYGRTAYYKVKKNEPTKWFIYFDPDSHNHSLAPQFFASINSLRELEPYITKNLMLKMGPGMTN